MRILKIVHLTALVLLLLSSNSHAQRRRRVKYKDLFPILQQQQYEEAEPFLRRFLVQDSDHPNANFQMALLFDHKALQVDVLGDPAEMKVLSDSAIIFYNNAIQYITQREIKRRDEYYIAYNRRDLRTGKFGIKLSDVHFDIENKIEGLHKRKERVDSLNLVFDALTKQYANVQGLYQELVADFETETRLFLLASDATDARFSEIQQSYLKAMQLQQDFARILKSIPNARYRSNPSINPIQVYGVDGMESTDFKENQPIVWNYDEWVEASRAIIGEEVQPLRQELVDYDAKFSILYGDFLNGRDIGNSLSLDRSLIEKLDRFDPESLPKLLFTYKLDELQYYMAEKQLRDPRDNDTLSIIAELNRHDSISQILATAEEAYSLLEACEITDASRIYPRLFAERYNGLNGFNEFLQNRKQFLGEARVQVDEYLEGWKSRDLKGIWSPDTVIMLVQDSVVIDSNLEQGAYTLAVEKFDEENYWVGGMFFDPGAVPMGYVARFGPERIADWRHQIPLTEFPALDSLLSLTSRVLWKDEQVQYVVFYNQIASEDGFTGIVARLDEGALTWQSPITLNRPVKEVKYRTFEEDVKFYLEELDGMPRGSNYVLVSNMGEVTLPDFPMPEEEE